MLFFYSILVSVAGLFLKVAALFNSKIKLFVGGRKTVFKTLKEAVSKNDRIIWFHTASLGEFEQGLPVIEEVKKKYPHHKILLTFFSPSGYEVKKKTTAADIVCYLPLDTKKNARQFLTLVQPDLAVFVKYEFWPNYLAELKKRKIKTLSISAVFRENQPFFRWYGGLLRNSLSTFNHFFVQDQNSEHLLKTIGLQNVTVSGDTRFDRVLQILERDNTLSFIAAFKQDKPCFVAGSSWPEDEEVLVNFINSRPEVNLKYIIAPHNIKEGHILALKNSVTARTVLYSEMKNKNLEDYQVFIVDTIGILSKIYSYATIAYVGGGMGTTGLHNTLEPAVFGIPVIIGKNYSKFKEARELSSGGGLISVQNRQNFDQVMLKLMGDSSLRSTLGKKNLDYIIQQKGATEKICCHINDIL